MRPSERIRQREAAAAKRRALRAHVVLWDSVYGGGCSTDDDREAEDHQVGSIRWLGRFPDAINAYQPEITPEDLAPVKPKQSIWQQIKGWLK